MVLNVLCSLSTCVSLSVYKPMHILNLMYAHKDFLVLSHSFISGVKFIDTLFFISISVLDFLIRYLKWFTPREFGLWQCFSK